MSSQRRRRVTAWCAASLMLPLGLSAQVPLAAADPPPLAPGVSAALDSVRAMRGATLTVSLYTYGPSDVFFERFGHAAIGVRDSASGEDVAYNWGVFDFDQPNFLLRFLTGDTEYSMVGYPTERFNDVYRGDNRTIRQQILAFTPVERAALWEYLQWNAREAHRYYRYDYYRENCATKLRDVLDRALNGSLKKELVGPGSGRTWRGETARLLGSIVPMYAGIEIALGRRADAPLSRWDEEFLPEVLASHYAALVISRPDGRRRRLVTADTTLYLSTRAPLPLHPPARVVIAALLGLTCAGLLAVLADARSAVARVALTLLVGGWYLVGGVLGTVLLLAVTLTRHAPYMGANTTLLVLQPLLLLAAWIVPVALWRGEPSQASRGVSTTVAVMSVVALVLQLVPGLAQSSGVVLAAVVPVHVAIALALWRMGQEPSRHPRAR